MGIQLRFAAFSDVGLVRSNNQDAGYASPNLLVLADGMGGAAAGDVASSVAVGHLASLDDDVYGADDLIPLLRTAVSEAHTDLVDRAKADPELGGMGTTCIAILRSSNKLGMVHIGDSRAYLLRDGVLTQVTHDHTLVQFLVDHGQITPEEAENHPKRNVIMRALGDTPGDVEIDESIREAVPGDRWLLCSDGLFGVVAHDTIESTLASMDIVHAGERLIELALAGGAPDNVTVVLAEVVDDKSTHEVPRSQHPIVVGSAAVDYRKPTRGGTSAAAKAAALTSKRAVKDAAESESEALPEEPPRSRAAARLAVAVAVLAIMFGGLFAAYRWTQGQYYVAVDGGRVTIYRGIPESIGPISFSSVYERTNIRVSQLPSVARERLSSPITRSSLSEARTVVSNLRAQRSTPSPSPSPSPSATTPAPTAPGQGQPEQPGQPGQPAQPGQPGQTSNPTPGANP